MFLLLFESPPATPARYPPTTVAPKDLEYSTNFAAIAAEVLKNGRYSGFNTLTAALPPRLRLGLGSTALQAIFRARKFLYRLQITIWQRDVSVSSQKFSFPVLICQSKLMQIQRRQMYHQQTDTPPWKTITNRCWWTDMKNVCDCGQTVSTGAAFHSIWLLGNKWLNLSCYSIHCRSGLAEVN